jgi:hypothetical protein
VGPGRPLLAGPFYIEYRSFGVARFLLIKYTKKRKSIPNYHKIYQMVIKFIK